jgi:hypothetical protein
MIQAKQMQDRRMQVMHVNFFRDCVVTDFVGRAVNVASLGSATSQPDRKASWVMVSAILSLGKRRAAKLTPPPDQRIVQQTALLTDPPTGPATG